MIYMWYTEHSNRWLNSRRVCVFVSNCVRGFARLSHHIFAASRLHRKTIICNNNINKNHTHEEAYRENISHLKWYSYILLLSAIYIYEITYLDFNESRTFDDRLCYIYHGSLPYIGYIIITMKM